MSGLQKQIISMQGRLLLGQCFRRVKKTMTHISQCTKDSGFKMVITQVEVLRTKPYLASYSHADMKPLKSVQRNYSVKCLVLELRNIFLLCRAII